MRILINLLGMFGEPQHFIFVATRPPCLSHMSIQSLGLLDLKTEKTVCFKVAHILAQCEQTYYCKKILIHLRAALRYCFTIDSSRFKRVLNMLGHIVCGHFF